MGCAFGGVGTDPSFAVGRGQTLRRQLIQKLAQLGLWEGTDPSAEAVERVSLGCNFAGTDPSAEGVGKVSLG